MAAETDRWAAWLLERRHGGDEKQLASVLQFLEPVRDRVLEGAELRKGDTLLDVGAGDGLIAFAALDRVGTSGKVIWSDVSETLRDHARSLARDMDAAERMEFLLAGADDLAPVASASVDAVTTRSVLIYVDDKKRAFKEFFRVLRPGGRLSIFEPINRFGLAAPRQRFWGYDVTPIQEIADKVRRVFEEAQPPERDPMLNFDERDLLTLVEEAAFVDIRLNYEAEITHAPLWTSGWDSFLRFAGNPNAPTLQEAMKRALSASERDKFEGHLRPLVDAGEGLTRGADAFVRAVKPGNGRPRRSRD